MNDGIEDGALVLPSTTPHGSEQLRAHAQKARDAAHPSGAWPPGYDIHVFPGQRPSLLDLAHQAAFRLGFPFARIWWQLRRPTHEGALVAVHVGPKLLVVRNSYRRDWNFPGGGIRSGETPESTARRELEEELGIRASNLLHLEVASGIWDGRRARVHFLKLRPENLIAIRLDNREVTAARLVSPAEFAVMPLTGPVAAYRKKRFGPVPRPFGSEDPDSDTCILAGA